MLLEAGAEVTHAWSEAGHGLDRSELDPIRAWLAGHEDAFSGARGEQV